MRSVGDNTFVGMHAPYRKRRTQALLLLLLFSYFTARADDLRPNLDQYLHTSWRIKDGVIDAPPSAITQTSDGYLWIGSDSGLWRFDGLRFVPLSTIDGSDRPLRVISLLGAMDGTLWIGTNSSLERWDGQQIQDVPRSGIGRINAIAEDLQGGIWAARTRFRGAGGPLCHSDHGHFQCLGAEQGMECLWGQSLARARDGNVWMGSNPGVCGSQSGHGSSILPHGIKVDGRTSYNAGALAFDVSGTLLVGFSQSGPHLGLEQVVGSSLRPVNADGFKGEDLSVTCLLVDREGGTWVGTQNSGLYHIARGRADHLGSADGLSSDAILTLFEDSEGNVWAGTSEGLDRLQRPRVLTVSQREGLSSDAALSVTTLPEGTIATGTMAGLSLIKPGEADQGSSIANLPGKSVTSLLADEKGRIWAGVDDGLYLYERGTFTSMRDEAGNKVGLISDLVEDTSHRIWAVNSSGRTARLFHSEPSDTKMHASYLPNFSGSIASSPNGGVWLQTEQGIALLRSDTLRSYPSPTSAIDGMATDPAGHLWEWGKTGLVEFNGQGWRVFSKANGLPCDQVNGISFDASGAWWIKTRCGIAAFRAQDVAAWERGHVSALHPAMLLTSVDGVRGGASSFTPMSTFDHDGRLWFATGNQLQVVDLTPTDLRATAPRVHIETAEGAGRHFARSGTIVFPKGTEQVSFTFTGIDLADPLGVLLRYEIPGVDHLWQEAGDRRQASYQHLTPGRYAFKVTACSRNGACDEIGDTLAFAVLPMFYQTLWFKMFLLLATLCLVYVALSLRVKKVKQDAEARFALRVSERDRIARELHDTLLQGLQAVILKFQAAADDFDSTERGRKLMDDALDRADTVLIQSRDRVRELRSTGNHQRTLEDDLRAFVNDDWPNDLTRIAIVATGPAKLLLFHVREEISAIAREALRNAIVHTEATQIICRLVYARRFLEMVCSDDGPGIPHEVVTSGGKDGHWGLLGMRERAKRIGATLHIVSSAAGTRVQFKMRASLAYEKPTAGSYRWLRSWQNHADRD